ncbi:ABC-type nitrate/sulfonate/bicarbonate transport system substrate-binding protein [Rhizobium petrolearium]|uniref:ABC transporter substrate-binding protein n=1 Tax=Neorhizobium petrolearium TaxID=515361 RepID=UPI001AE27D49|nr:ABC transporter substrate-binding protein [Neorhizobium petrolearium]MBP1845858.1 ABC-type nitrate/sulfonate/bicarbonate transport system substrate-binding protein [Neorhizobium petrolearium]
MSDLQTVRVIAFPGAPNLPTFAAIAQGFFVEEGLNVEVSLTPSSVAQAEKTAAGEFDIVFTAFDNVVAYGEGQGATTEGVNPDYVVLMGATQLELAIVTAPEVKTYEDLKGRSIALDALTTGFAFVLFEMMARSGLSRDDVAFAAVGATPQRWQSVKAGEHAATLTIEPFTSIARRSGFNVLDVSSNHFDSYQGGVIAARRAYTNENPEPVKAFIRAYLKGLEWTLNPANREAGAALLQAKMPDIQPAAVPSIMASLLSPRSGLTPGAKILPEGMRAVLDLRSRYGSGNTPLTDISKYLDLSFYESVRGSK